MLRLIEQCDQCKMTCQTTSMLFVGEKNGVHKQSWWKLCPKCYRELYRKYVIKNVQVTKKQVVRTGLKRYDVQEVLDRHSKIWLGF
jgi:hypothetical protein